MATANQFQKISERIETAEKALQDLVIKAHTKDNMSVSEIVKASGLYATKVKAILETAGVTIVKHSRTAVQVTDEQKATVKQMSNEGKTAEEIAAAINVKAYKVNQIKKEMGLVKERKAVDSDLAAAIIETFNASEGNALKKAKAAAEAHNVSPQKVMEIVLAAQLG
jgi:hypothetical protein